MFSIYSCFHFVLFVSFFFFFQFSIFRSRQNLEQVLTRPDYMSDANVLSGLRPPDVRADHLISKALGPVRDGLSCITLRRDPSTALGQRRRLVSERSRQIVRTSNAVLVHWSLRSLLCAAALPRVMRCSSLLRARCCCTNCQPCAINCVTVSSILHLNTKSIKNKTQQQS